MFRKKKHRKKISVGLNVSKSKLSLSNSSANKNSSIAIRATLKANNRALAQALELSRHETRLAQESNIERLIEIQHLQQQVLNLERVAGLKDEDLEKEVHHRYRKKMLEIKTLLCEVTNKLMDAVNVLGTALEICSSRKSSSLGNEISPKESKQRTIYNYRRSQDGIFASKLSVPSSESYAMSRTRVLPSNLDMSIIAEQSLLSDEPDGDYLSTDVLQTVQEVSPPVEKSARSKRLSRRLSHASILHNQENSPSLPNEENATRKSKVLTRRLSRQSLSNNLSPNEAPTHLQDKKNSLQAQAANLAQVADILAQVTDSPEAASQNSLETFLTNSTSALNCGTTIVLRNKRKSISPSNLNQNLSALSENRRLTFCVPSASGKKTVFNNETKNSVQNLEQSSNKNSPTSRRATYFVSNSDCNSTTESSIHLPLSKERKLLLKLETMTQKRDEKIEFESLKKKDPLQDLQPIPPSPTFIGDDKTTHFPVDMDLTAVIDTGCMKVTTPIKVSGEESTQFYKLTNDSDDLIHDSEIIQQSSTRLNTFKKPKSKIPKKRRMSLGKRKRKCPHSGMVTSKSTVKTSPEERDIQNNKSEIGESCEQVNSEPTLSLPLSVFELSMNGSTHPDFKELTHIKKKNGPESVKAQKDIFDPVPTEATPRNSPCVTTRRKPSRSKSLVKSIDSEWTPLHSNASEMFTNNESSKVDKLNLSINEKKPHHLLPFNGLTPKIVLVRTPSNFNFVKIQNVEKVSSMPTETCTLFNGETSSSNERGRRKPKDTDQSRKIKPVEMGEVLVFDTPAKSVQSNEMAITNDETPHIYKCTNIKPKSPSRSRKARPVYKDKIMSIDTPFIPAELTEIAVTNNNISSGHNAKERKPKSISRSRKTKLVDNDKITIDTPVVPAQSTEIAVTDDNTSSSHNSKSISRSRKTKLVDNDKITIDTPVVLAQSTEIVVIDDNTSSSHNSRKSKSKSISRSRKTQQVDQDKITLIDTPFIPAQSTEIAVINDNISVHNSREKEPKSISQARKTQLVDQDEIALIDRPTQSREIATTDDESSSTHKSRRENSKSISRSRKIQPADKDKIIDRPLLSAQSTEMAISDDETLASHKSRSEYYKNTNRSRKTQPVDKDKIEVIGSPLIPAQFTEIATIDDNASSNHNSRKRNSKSRPRSTKTQLDKAIIDTPFIPAQSTEMTITDYETSSSHKSPRETPKSKSRSRKIQRVEEDIIALTDRPFIPAHSTDIALTNDDPSSNQNSRERKSKSTSRSRKTLIIDKEKITIDAPLKPAHSTEIAITEDETSSSHKFRKDNPKSKSHSGKTLIVDEDKIALTDKPLIPTEELTEIEITDEEISSSHKSKKENPKNTNRSLKIQPVDNNKIEVINTSLIPTRLTEIAIDYDDPSSSHNSREKKPKSTSRSRKTQLVDKDKIALIDTPLNPAQSIETEVTDDETSSNLKSRKENPKGTSRSKKSLLVNKNKIGLIDTPLIPVESIKIAIKTDETSASHKSRDENPNNISQLMEMEPIKEREIAIIDTPIEPDKSIEITKLDKRTKKIKNILEKAIVNGEYPKNLSEQENDVEISAESEIISLSSKSTVTSNKAITKNNATTSLTNELFTLSSECTKASVDTNAAILAQNMLDIVEKVRIKRERKSINYIEDISDDEECFEIADTAKNSRNKKIINRKSKKIPSTKLSDDTNKTTETCTEAEYSNSNREQTPLIESAEVPKPKIMKRKTVQSDLTDFNELLPQSKLSKMNIDLATDMGQEEDGTSTTSYSPKSNSSVNAVNGIEGRHPRRAASGLNFKEPSLGKKLRRGDPNWFSSHV